MQAFGNVATQPERKESKATGKAYWQFRVCESQRGVDDSPTWYTARIMKPDDPKLAQGDFVKVTGKLKADFYLSREGKPTGTLLIIAFEATKIAKPSAAAPESTGRADERAATGVSRAAPTVLPAVTSPLREEATTATVPRPTSAVPSRPEAAPVPPKRQLAQMLAPTAFALPIPVASPWGISFGAPVPVK